MGMIVMVMTNVGSRMRPGAYLASFKKIFLYIIGVGLWHLENKFELERKYIQKIIFICSNKTKC